MTEPSIRQATDERAALRVVLVSGAALFIIFGVRLAFSVFFNEFVTQEGWNSADSALIFSVSMLSFATFSTPAGILLDRFGPRIVFTTGALLLAAGLFFSSRSNTAPQLSLAYGIVGGSGLAIIGLGPIAANIAAWIPPERRGLAIGTAFAGTGLGSLIFVPLSDWLIQQFGWRNAYLTLAAICLLILAPLLAFGQKRPPAPNMPSRSSQTSVTAGAGWRTLLRRPLFWLMLIVSFLALSPLRSVSVHHIAYMVSVGIEREVAARYVGLAGFLTAGTFIGWGYISDRFGRTWAFTLGGLCLGGAVVILMLLNSWQIAPLLLSYSVLLALGEGTRSSQTTALASDVFQSSGLGFVNGAVGAMFGLGAAFGPWMVGKLRDQTGTYTPGLVAIIVMVSLSLVGFFIVNAVFRSRRR